MAGEVLSKVSPGSLAVPAVQGISPYVIGKPIGELTRELGVTEIIKLASNENPLGPSPLALAAAQASLADTLLYPDGNGFDLKDALARHHGVSAAQVTLGNGSNDLLVLLAEAFRLVGAGVASPQDVDKTIRDGLGLRWSFMGPFETIELNAPGGIADYCARYGESLTAMVAESGSGKPFGKKNVQKVMEEWTGAQTPERVAALSQWRDGRLASLKAHKKAAKRKPA
jgi:hypothetical protein